MKTKPIEFEPEPASDLDARLQNSIRSWREVHSELVDQREEVLTQQQVADLLEITQPAVSVFENSNSLGTQIGTIISYAAAIGLEVEFRIKDAGYPDLPEMAREDGPLQD